MGIKERAEERKKRIVAHRAANFKEAEEWDLAFWQSLTPEERLSALTAIRKDLEKVDRARPKVDQPEKESIMRTRKRPPAHPGRILRNHHLDPLSMTITDLADILRVSRKTVSKIINERGSITPDMALRLSRAFDTSPDLWLNLQKNYDLWHASQDSTDWRRVKPINITDQAFVSS